MDDFTYNNLTGRPMGPFVRIGTQVSAGVRTVQAHIAPYAKVWQERNKLALSQAGPLWIALGDSMTQGIGASSPDTGWVCLLQNRLAAAGRPYRLVNLSASGARVRDVLDVQLPLMQRVEPAPALLTVMIGSNDLVRKRYRLALLHDFAELLALLPEGSVVANLAGGQGLPLALDTLLQEVAAERNLRIADMRSMGPAGWRGKIAEDHFHPNDAGYQAIADVFATALGL